MGVVLPLHRAAEEMRDLYANEIARAVHAGEEPSAMQLESWAKYDRALREGDPSAAFSARTDQ